MSRLAPRVAASTMGVRMREHCDVLGGNMQTQVISLLQVYRIDVIVLNPSVFKNPYNVHLDFLICCSKSPSDSNIQQCACSSWIIFCVSVD